MENKQVATLVILVTAIANLVLFKVGVPQTLTCTVAKAMGASVTLAKDNAGL